jgi:endoglucanase
VDILTERDEIISGYVGVKSHHITESQEKYTVPSVHQLFIDVGLKSSEEVRKAVIQIGDPITYHPNFHCFGEGGICSKALDNRAGCILC